jgi:ferredoxin-NADP reductase
MTKPVGQTRETRRALPWRLATVVERVVETPRVCSLVLDVPGWPGHRPGQHADVRLTAEDGYQAQRSYSVASAPEDGYLVLTVERLADGEVSPYLVDEVLAGDQLELRGPVGGWFAWDSGLGGPLLLVAGGSGVVPFRAVLRHRAAVGSDVPVRLLYSARRWEEVVYADELARLAAYDEVDVRLTLTRAWPAGWQGYRGRVDASLLAEVAWPTASDPLAYVCGPTGFVEVVADTLVRSGHDPARVRTERFGPTG